MIFAFKQIFLTYRLCFLHCGVGFDSVRIGATGNVRTAVQRSPETGVQHRPPGASDGFDRAWAITGRRRPRPVGCSNGYRLHQAVDGTTPVGLRPQP